MVSSMSLRAPGRFQWTGERPLPRPGARVASSGVTVTRPPREAAVEATAAAVAWLGQYLAAGPRYSAQLRRDAVADGLQLPALHRAATELAVVRTPASRWSTWGLPSTTDQTAERRCVICHEVLGLEQFRRPPTAGYPAGRLVPTCNECTAARSCRPETSAAVETETKRCSTCGVRRPLDMFSRSTSRRDGHECRCRSCRAVARRGDTPALAEAQVDRAASFAPDSAPAIALRRELVDARRSGLSFSEAWPTCMATALDNSADRERADWQDVFLETSSAWRAGFERTDAMAGHGALAILAEAA